MASAHLITNFPRMAEFSMMTLMYRVPSVFSWTANVSHSLRLLFLVHHLSASIKGLRFMYLKSKLSNTASMSF